MYGFWGDNCKIMQQAKQRRQNKAKAYRSLRPQTFSIDCFAIKLPSAESFAWDPLNSWHPSSFVESVVVAIAVTLSWTHEEQQIQCVFSDADVVVVSCGVRMNTVMLRSYQYNERTNRVVGRLKACMHLLLCSTSAYVLHCHHQPTIQWNALSTPIYVIQLMPSALMLYLAFLSHFHTMLELRNLSMVWGYNGGRQILLVNKIISYFIPSL